MLYGTVLCIVECLATCWASRLDASSIRPTKSCNQKDVSRLKKSTRGAEVPPAENNSCMLLTKEISESPSNYSLYSAFQWRLSLWFHTIQMYNSCWVFRPGNSNPVLLNHLCMEVDSYFRSISRQMHSPVLSGKNNCMKFILLCIYYLRGALKNCIFHCSKP